MRMSIVGLIAGVLFAGIVGGRVYQVLGQRADAVRNASPGMMVDAGGHRLHLRVMGEEHAGPTVVLDTGSGGTSAAWGWVQPEIATFARVVSYDRAGLGWSETGPDPRDARQIATELHTALHNAGIEEPYVLVGHSFGGHVVRVFSALYPDEVAGLVLVDSSAPEHIDTMPVPVMSGVIGIIRGIAGVGLLRAFNLSQGMVSELPEAARAEIRQLTATDRHWQAVQAEIRALPATAEQVRSAGSLGNLPLVVVSASTTEYEDWHNWQAEMAALSTRGEMRIVPNSDHDGLVMDREQAVHTIAAVRDVLAMADE